jgi:hypothetical protein
VSVLSTWLLRGCSRARTRQSGSCQKRRIRCPVWGTFAPEPRRLVRSAPPGRY